MARKSGRRKPDPAEEAFEAGTELVKQHPLLRFVLGYCAIYRNERTSECPDDGWALVSQSGAIHAHPKRRGEPEEWAYVIAHCLLHLGFGHIQAKEQLTPEWQAACDVVVTRFLRDLKFGRNPVGDRMDLPGGTEDSLFRRFREGGIPSQVRDLSVAGTSGADMVWGESWWDDHDPRQFQRALAEGLTDAVAAAVEIAGGAGPGLKKEPDTAAQQARKWFMSSYPLLGALASAFEIVEDPEICRRWDIWVAAVDPAASEIFINPLAGLEGDECRFVMAHELLHVALRHQERCQGRDHYLWNVACDFVINAWLVEMRLGELPKLGGLYDPELKGMSAEAVYDLIVKNLRKYRKLATLRGVGLSDILSESRPDARAHEHGMDLDDFYRRCLAQGFAYWEQSGRGFLPAGLIEEIRATIMPAIPWDVRLAQWFDGFFAPPEKRRSFARPSRRQSATPEMPRPRYVPLEDPDLGRTFGVVLDTSGSMAPEMLAKALGSVASYALSREVPLVRVVFCDADAYDAGYLPPEAIADRVKIKGRGGTILQPGVDLLERASDFPRLGPILVITDGQCDRVKVHREHAFVLPRGRSLPFAPKGPVFLMN
jgi:predicted metal-dependent peptidase